MLKSMVHNFSVHLSGKAPDCPFLGAPCVRFNVNLAHGICSKNVTRCRYLPYWVASVYRGLYAVLEGNILHV